MATQSNTTGHSIFSLIPTARRHDDGHSDSRDLSIEIPYTLPATSSFSELEERFPSVLVLIQRVWGTPEALRAFRALILDGNGQVRQWPREVWDELVLLRNVHDAAYIHGANLPVNTASGRVDLDRYPVLEVRYRHVLERICAAWGDPVAFTGLFHRLVIDDRGDREGWPADAWLELVFLQQVHDLAYKKAVRKPVGPEPTGLPGARRR